MSNADGSYDLIFSCGYLSRDYCRFDALSPLSLLGLDSAFIDLLAPEFVDCAIDLVETLGALPAPANEGEGRIDGVNSLAVRAVETDDATDLVLEVMRLTLFTN